MQFSTSSKMVEVLGLTLRQQMQMACRSGDLEVVRRLFMPSQGSGAGGYSGGGSRPTRPDVSMGNEDAEEPFGYPTISGLDVDGALDEYGWTPLITASRHGNVEVVRFLIELQADLNIKDNAGRVALHHAAEHGHEGVVRLILHGAVEDHHRRRPVYVTTPGEELAEVNVVDDQQYTALHLCARHGHERVVKLMLECGADPTARVPVKRRQFTDGLHYSDDESTEDEEEDGARFGLGSLVAGGAALGLDSPQSRALASGSPSHLRSSQLLTSASSPPRGAGSIISSAASQSSKQARKARKEEEARKKASGWVYMTPLDEANASNTPNAAVTQMLKDARLAWHLKVARARRQEKREKGSIAQYWCDDYCVLQ